MSFRLVTDATVARYLAFIARMVAGGLALHRVQSLGSSGSRVGKLIG
jgi:hypothetical protein